MVVSYLIALIPTQEILAEVLYLFMVNIPSGVLQGAAVVPGFFLAAYAADRGLSLKKLGIFLGIVLAIELVLTVATVALIPNIHVVPYIIAVAYVVAFTTVYRPGLDLFKEEPEAA